MIFLGTVERCLIHCDSPVHLLADTVAAILENRLHKSAKPHAVTPIPLASRGSTVKHLNTAPFQAEFEVAAALWEPRLFPIVSPALPALDDTLVGPVELLDQLQRSGIARTPTVETAKSLISASPSKLDALLYSIFRPENA